MKRKNDGFNRITGSSKSSLECSAGQMTFIPLSKGDTVNKETGNYLRSIYNPRIREIYDSLRIKLIDLIGYIPKIV
ncbi:MAG: hypothetical protein Q8N63_05220 [Nanoarchaeota archaeon]|nr:hypothetical protein [Nanoarchaeota archaeon]